MSNLHADLDAVIDAELALLTADVRRDPDRVRALLHEDFSEFGCSGRVWDRASTLDLLAHDPGEGVVAHGLHAERLADDVVLLTYDSETGGVCAHRTSIWVRDGDGQWRMRHHQGTPAADA